MPRQQNPIGIAAGKLILAIQKERDSESGESDAGVTQRIANRAHTLLQASRTASVTNLLDGRSLKEYLDVDWVAAHPKVHPSIEALALLLAQHEGDSAL
jgi:hypothetical protein